MKTLKPSSDHLKESLKIKVGNDKKGNPILIGEKKLILLGIKFKGEKKLRFKRS